MIEEAYHLCGLLWNLSSPNAFVVIFEPDDGCPDPSIAYAGMCPPVVSELRHCAAMLEVKLQHFGVSTSQYGKTADGRMMKWASTILEPNAEADFLELPNPPRALALAAKTFLDAVVL